MNQTERFYKIEQLLHDRGVVSFQTLLDELEVSRATLKRDLAYLRDRFNAPIVHDRDAGGYRFDKSTNRRSGQAASTNCPDCGSPPRKSMPC